MEDFEEDQVSLRRWKRHFGLIDQMADQRAIRRTLTADESISPAELLYICDQALNWRAELEGIIDFMNEYRQVEPEVVEENPALQALESETREQLIWMSSIDTRCSPN